MAITITAPRPTEHPGVEAMKIEGSAFSWAYLGWSDQMVRLTAGGRTAVGLAGEIVSRLVNTEVGFLRHELRGFRWGPGGRRVYFVADEALADRILRENNPANARNRRERARSEEIEAFVLALLDVI